LWNLVLPETSGRRSREYDWGEQRDDQHRGYFDYLNPLYAESPSSKSQFGREDDRLTSSNQSSLDHAAHTNTIVLNSDYLMNTTGTGTISSLNDW
jgi:hypothetical protein